MFVIINMLNAMFNRYYGIPHGLHRTLDNAYIKVKEMIILNEEANHELAEFIFKPEEDPDDTN